MPTDNVPITPGSGVKVATRDVTYSGESAQVQAVSLVNLAGADDAKTASDVSAANPFPTYPTGDPVSFWPGYGIPNSTDLRRLTIDDDLALVTRSAVLTDEGTFRANFANSSLAVALGTVTLTNGSKTVTWSISATTDVHIGDYIKLDADAESAWAQIASLESSTSATLVDNYTGTGGTSTGSRALIRPTTGSGGSISVASGQVTLATGTTTASETRLWRYADYGPLIVRQRLSVSQRIINQTIYCGLTEGVAIPRWFARFTFDNTTNTTVKCQTGRNPTGAPSVNEIEETNITLPGGVTTAVMNEYRIELLTETVRFYVNKIVVAEHSRVIPAQHDEMTAGVWAINGTSPATTTSVVIDYLACKNHNKLEIGVLSDLEQIVAVQPPATNTLYNVAGVIAINTVLMFMDCSQFRSVSIQCTSMGTTGVVTPEWSNDGATWLTATLRDQTGALSTTFNAAGLRVTGVQAQFFRLRLSTATTAGTTTIRLVGFQSDITPLPVATQPVSGTVTANIGTGSLAAGTNLAMDVGQQYRTSVTGAGTITNINCPTAATAQTIKGSAGRLIGMYLVNTEAATVYYLKVYNIVSPTLGSSTAALRIPLPPSQPVYIAFEGGMAFSTAIVVCVTTNKSLTVSDGTMVLDAVMGFTVHA